MVKVCCKCKQEKPRSEFHNRPDRGSSAVVSNCKSCCSIARKAARISVSSEEKERALELARQWKRDNKEQVKKQKKIWESANPEKVRHYNIKGSRNFRKNNKELCNKRTLSSRDKKKDYYKEQGRQWQKDNPGYCRAKYKAYMTTKMNAMPSWANVFFIQEIYDLAQLRTEATGVKHHVDHIVPLQSKLVCGLHTEQNLQVVPYYENLSKGNRYWPDMPTEKLEMEI